MQHDEETVSERTAVPPAGSTVARLAAAWVLWIALAAPLHFAWEWAQAPLYTLWRNESGAVITYSIAHCTAGDALIAAASYLAGAAGSRAVDWPSAAPLRGLSVAWVLGIGYTAFSEWRNVYRLGSWTYTEAMPTIAGIGVAPLLQWLFVPLAMVFLWRRLWPNGPMAMADRSRHSKENGFNNGGDA